MGLEKSENTQGFILLVLKPAAFCEQRVTNEGFDLVAVGPED